MSDNRRSDSSTAQEQEARTTEAAIEFLHRAVSERNGQLEAAIPGLTAVLADAGVDAILLKGPVTRQRLYRPDELRSTSDIDLLVSAHRHRRARASLAVEGFRVVASGGHSDTLRRDGIDIDLHLTLPFVTVAPRRAFVLLEQHTTTIALAGYDVTCLDEPAHALHLAIHAAQNRFDPAYRPLDEWRRCATQLTGQQLATAAVLAAELGVRTVWLAAWQALEPSADAPALTAGLPRRRPGTTTRATREFITSGLPRRVRWRAGRAFLRRQLGDAVVIAWRTRRGIPPPPPRTWSMRRAKLSRLVTIVTTRSPS